MALIYQEQEIGLNVLGIHTQSENTGPLITFPMARGASPCRVPVTVTPGNLENKQLNALF